MEIPYTITPRKDTGLYNAKVGIWLFLASEVMLFGGLFSGYIFLRIYSDFPWPERTLPVVPGLINTFILIGSSVTVVFAWAALKMRKWFQFQVFMSITLLCAGAFMVLKGIEYKAKWSHQAVRMKDFVILEGHSHKATIDSHGEIHHYHAKGHKTSSTSEPVPMASIASGGLIPAAANVGETDSHSDEAHGGHDKAEGSEPFEYNKVVFKTEEILIGLDKFYDPIISDVMAQANRQGVKLQLSQDYVGRPNVKQAEQVLAKKGDLLSLTLLKKLRGTYLDAKSNNAKIRTKQNRDAWANLRKELKNNGEEVDQPSYLIKDQLKLNPEFDQFLVKVNSTVRFVADDTCTLVLNPRDVREQEKSATLRDGSILTGMMDSHGSAIEMAADAIDFRFVAQRAKEKNIDPQVAIANTWLIKNHPEVKALWEAHNQKILKLESHLLKEHGVGKDGKPKQEPTFAERYRIGWQELVNMGKGEQVMGLFSGFAGPNHKKDYAQYFPEITVPREEVNLESKFTPRWNTYYAIYFLITGLHGLHVIGGIIVLGYFLFFGRKMYDSTPERLANRVEVAGLFWHFVDLVWIFLFPILYLM